MTIKAILARGSPRSEGWWASARPGQVNVSVSSLTILIALFIRKYRQLPREQLGLMLLQSEHCQPPTPPDSPALSTIKHFISLGLQSALISNGSAALIPLMCRYHAISKLEIGAETI